MLIIPDSLTISLTDVYCSIKRFSSERQVSLTLINGVNIDLKGQLSVVLSTIITKLHDLKGVCYQTPLCSTNRQG